MWNISKEEQFVGFGHFIYYDLCHQIFHDLKNILYGTKLKKKLFI